MDSNELIYCSNKDLTTQKKNVWEVTNDYDHFQASKEYPQIYSN